MVYGLGKRKLVFHFNYRGLFKVLLLFLWVLRESGLLATLQSQSNISLPEVCLNLFVFRSSSFMQKV